MPLTARDFVFSWNRVLDPETASQYAFILYPIKNAEAINRGSMPGATLGVRAASDRILEVDFERPTISTSWYLSDLFSGAGDFYNCFNGR